MGTPITYTLKVNGAAADAQLTESILSVEVEDHALLADVARIKVATALTNSGAAWAALDGPLCQRLTNIKIGVRIGGDSETPLIDGYVIDVRANLSPNPQTASLDVVAMDATVLLDLEEKVRAWPDQSDSSIASAIFGEHSFDTNVTSTDPVRQSNDVTTMQRGTDMRFLRRLAERNGYECYVDVGDQGQTVAHFHAPDLQQTSQAVLSVNLGSETTLDEFKVRYDMLAATQVKASGVDAQSGSEQSAQAQSASLHDQGDTSTVGSDRPRVRLVSGRGLSDGGELQTLSQAVVDRSAFAITAEGLVNAAALAQVLKAKQPVLVRGAGTQFSGEYYVERVLHRFDESGYQQRVTLKRNAVGVLRQDSFVEDDSAPSQPAVTV